MRVGAFKPAARLNAGALAGAALIALAVFGPTNAWAISPGCAAFHGSYLHDANNVETVTGNVTVNAFFAKGDIVSFTSTGPGNAAFLLSEGVPAVFAGNYQGGYLVFQAGAVRSAELQRQQSLLNQVVTFTWTCTPAGGLDEAKQAFSKMAAATTSQAMGDATSGAISDAFSGGGTTQFGQGSFSTSFAAIEYAQNADSDKKRDPFESFNALRDAKAPYLKPPPRLQSPWHVWIDGRYTGFEDRSAIGFDGWQSNITGGASYRFTESFLAGVLVGYEKFKYSANSFFAPTSLDGNGVHGGGYFGWKFYDRLRLDGMLTYGRVDYGTTAGIVAGSFGADRITGMSKLSGRFALGAYFIEPSAMLTIAREHQDSFTDSLGLFHDTFKFTVGRSSNGATIGTPIAWGQCVVTPTFGAFGDYRFGDETIAAANVVPTFNNGWSAHVNGGLSISMPNNVTASATGEYGGLGDQIQYWRAKGSLGVKF